MMWPSLRYLAKSRNSERMIGMCLRTFSGGMTTMVVLPQIFLHIFQSKCIGSYIDNNVQKKSNWCTIRLVCLRRFVWYKQLLNLDRFRKIYLIFSMEGKNWAQGYFQRALQYTSRNQIPLDKAVNTTQCVYTDLCVYTPIYFVYTIAYVCTNFLTLLYGLLNYSDLPHCVTPY